MVDRLAVRFIHLRYAPRSAVLGLLFGVLPVRRGREAAGSPSVCLRTMAEVFAHTQAEGIEPRLDATNIWVRRPLAGDAGRRAFVWGKTKQNTMNGAVVADHKCLTLPKASASGPAATTSSSASGRATQQARLHSPAPRGSGN